MDFYSASIQLALDASNGDQSKFAEWATKLSTEFTHKNPETILADIKHEFNLRNAFKQMSERGLLARLRELEEV